MAKALAVTNSNEWSNLSFTVQPMWWRLEVVEPTVGSKAAIVFR